MRERAGHLSGCLFFFFLFPSFSLTALTFVKIFARLLGILDLALSSYFLLPLRTSVTYPNILNIFKRNASGLFDFFSKYSKDLNDTFILFYL